MERILGRVIQRTRKMLARRGLLEAVELESLDQFHAEAAQWAQSLLPFVEDPPSEYPSVRVASFRTAASAHALS